MKEWTNITFLRRFGEHLERVADEEERAGAQATEPALSSTTRGLPRWRWRVLALGLIAVVAAAALTVSYRDSQAVATETAIEAVISGYETAMGESFGIPPDAVPVLKKALAAIRPVPRPVPMNSEGIPVPRILPQNAWNEIARRYDAVLAKYGTERFRRNGGGGSVIAADTNAGLYNNPQVPPIIEERTKVLAVEVKKFEDSTCIAWAYIWTGDVSTEGEGTQSWNVTEYVLVNEGGEWRIDDRRTLTIMTAFDNRGHRYSDEWGPYAPHQPVDQGDSLRHSQLYPDYNDTAYQDSELRKLEAEALAGK